jgi:hypothetical protein
MKTITKYFFFLLAISFAFGSFNPLDLGASMNITDHEGEQKGFTPILFGMCTLLSLFDAEVRKGLKGIKIYITPLYCLLGVYFFSALIYDISSVADFLGTFVKLFVAFSGFIVFTQYFIVHHDVFKWTMRVFALTCSLIMVLFFTGRLEGLYYYSKGRLVLFGENANSYSFVMGLGVLILIRGLSYKWPVFVKFLFVGMSIVIYFYILMSGSRGTVLILGLALAIAYIDFLKKHAVISVAVVGAAGVLLLYMFNSSTEELSIFSRMEKLSNGDERSNLIENALTLFYQSPLWGVGVNGYYDAKANLFHDMRDSHNMIVSIMVNGGLVGFIAISTFLLRVFRNAKSVFRYDKYPVALFTYMFLISMKTGGILSYSLMWFVYALIIATTYYSRLANIKK